MQMVTRHHLLYPHRLWQLGYSQEVSIMTGYLRGKFIIKLPEPLHVELHKHVDPLLPYPITESSGLTPQTIATLYAFCKKSESDIEAMSALEKIQWLLDRINPYIERNEGVITCLVEQMDFLRAHEGEY